MCVCAHAAARRSITAASNSKADSSCSSLRRERGDVVPGDPGRCFVSVENTHGRWWQPRGPAKPPPKATLTLAGLETGLP